MEVKGEIRITAEKTVSSEKANTREREVEKWAGDWRMAPGGRGGKDVAMCSATT